MAPEPFLHREQAAGGRLAASNRRRERSVGAIVRDHPRRYGGDLQRWAAAILEREGVPLRPPGRAA